MYRSLWKSPISQFLGFSGSTHSLPLISYKFVVSLCPQISVPHLGIYTSAFEYGKSHQLHYSLGLQSELSFWCFLLNHPRRPVLDFTCQARSPHVALRCLPCWVPGLELHLFGKRFWKNIRFTILLAWWMLMERESNGHQKSSHILAKGCQI